MLVGTAFGDETAPAVRAARRKRCVDNPVDVRRRHAVTVAAVGGPRAATGTGRLLGRISFRERCRLALARTAGLLEETLQVGDAGITTGERFAEPVDGSGQATDLIEQLLVGAGFSARGSGARNSRRYAQTPRRWWIPLSKYLRSKLSRDPVTLDRGAA